MIIPSQRWVWAGRLRREVTQDGGLTSLILWDSWRSIATHAK